MEEGRVNNVGSLRIRRPPLQNQNDIDIKKWLLKSRKTRMDPSSYVILADVNLIMHQLETMFPYIRDKLESRAFTAGMHPSDKKLLDDLRDEYRIYQQIKSEYEALEARAAANKK